MVRSSPRTRARETCRLGQGRTDDASPPGLRLPNQPVHRRRDLTPIFGACPEFLMLLAPVLALEGGGRAGLHPRGNLPPVPAGSILNPLRGADDGRPDQNVRSLRERT